VLPQVSYRQFVRVFSPFATARTVFFKSDAVGEFFCNGKNENAVTSRRKYLKNFRTEAKLILDAVVLKQGNGTGVAKKIVFKFAGIRRKFTEWGQIRPSLVACTYRSFVDPQPHIHSFRRRCIYMERPAGSRHSCAITRGLQTAP